MKRTDAQIWLLLLLVGPLCGNTCTFHSTSGNGSVHIAVCTPPSSTVCEKGVDEPSPADEVADFDENIAAETETIEVNSRTVSRTDASTAHDARSGSSLHLATSAQPTGAVSALRSQVAGNDISSPSEPVPALGPLSISFLVAGLGAAASRKLRPNNRAE